jgi:hypothetical protein
MSGLSMRQNTKQGLLRGVCGFTLAALIGLFSPGVSTANESQLWSVVTHIEYVSGFEYEITFATGVSTSSLPSILKECGSAHGSNRGVIRYHCYPVAE